MAKRKGLSKRVRFEVFKRDKFRCQYCGREAPEVVLHVDHIKPVAKGGDNSITNLVTACSECNLGKSDKELSDDAAVKRQKAQLDELQERREQLEMMMEWQKGLTEGLINEADIVSQVIKDLSGYAPDETGVRELRRLINQFGVAHVCDSARIAYTQYDTSTDSGWEYAFDKLGGICYRTLHDTCWDCIHFNGWAGWYDVDCDEYSGVRSTKEAEGCKGFVKAKR